MRRSTWLTVGVVLVLLAVLVRFLNADGGPVDASRLPAPVADAREPDAPAELVESTDSVRSRLGDEAPALALLQAETNLEETDRVWGTVRLRETGEPIVGGHVLLRFSSKITRPSKSNPDHVMKAPDGHRWADGQSTTTDDEGRYSFELLPGARLREVEVSPPEFRNEAGIELVSDHYRLGRFASTTIPLPETDLTADLEQDLFVTEGVVFSGQVADAQSLMPIEGAVVGIHTSDDTQYVALSDENGAFRIAGLEAPLPGAAELKLTAACERYFRRDMTFVANPSLGPQPYLQVDLQRGVYVSGRVIDGEGRGVDRAPLRLFAQVASRSSGATSSSVRAKQLAHWVDTKSASDGSFRFPMVVAAHSGEIIVRPEFSAYTGARVSNLDLSEDRRDVVVQLELGAWVNVRASYPDGTIASPAVFQIGVYDEDFGWLSENFARDGYRGIHVNARTETTLHLFGTGPLGEKPRRSYRGEALIRTGAPRSSAIDVLVPLHLVDSEEPPKRAEGVRFWEINAGFEFRHAIDLYCVDSRGDRITDQPVSLRADDFEEGASSTGSSGTLRVVFQPGVHHLFLEVEGYEPQYLELDCPVTPYSELTVAFEPLD